MACITVRLVAMRTDAAAAVAALSLACCNTLRNGRQNKSAWCDGDRASIRVSECEGERKTCEIVQHSSRNCQIAGIEKQFAQKNIDLLHR